MLSEDRKHLWPKFALSCCIAWLVCAFVIIMAAHDPMEWRIAQRGAGYWPRKTFKSIQSALDKAKHYLTNATTLLWSSCPIVSSFHEDLMAAQTSIDQSLHWIVRLITETFVIPTPTARSNASTQMTESEVWLSQEIPRGRGIFNEL